MNQSPFFTSSNPQDYDDYKKLNKMAQNYPRIKAQNAVLKKALIAEQAKTTEYQQIISNLEKKFENIQTSHDDLAFQNERLIKKLSYAQNDIHSYEDNSPNKSSSSAWGLLLTGGKTETDMLRQKIKSLKEEIHNSQVENEGLHKELFDLQRTNKAAIQTLESKLSTLKSSIIEYENQISEIQKTKTQLEYQLQKKDQEHHQEFIQTQNTWEQSQKKYEEKFQSYGHMHQQLSFQLSQLSSKYYQHVVFDDHADEIKNQLNLPLYHRHIVIKRIEVYQLMENNLQQLHDHLQNLTECLTRQISSLSPSDEQQFQSTLPSFVSMSVIVEALIDRLARVIFHSKQESHLGTNSESLLTPLQENESLSIFQQSTIEQLIYSLFTQFQYFIQTQLHLYEDSHIQITPHRLTKTGSQLQIAKAQLLESYRELTTILQQSFDPFLSSSSIQDTSTSNSPSFDLHFLLLTDIDKIISIFLSLKRIFIIIAGRYDICFSCYNHANPSPFFQQIYKQLSQYFLSLSTNMNIWIDISHKYHHLNSHTPSESLNSFQIQCSKHTSDYLARLQQSFISPPCEIPYHQSLSLNQQLQTTINTLELKKQQYQIIDTKYTELQVQNQISLNQNQDYQNIIKTKENDIESLNQTNYQLLNLNKHYQSIDLNPDRSFFQQITPDIYQNFIDLTKISSFSNDFSQYINNLYQNYSLLTSSSSHKEPQETTNSYHLTFSDHQFKANPFFYLHFRDLFQENLSLKTYLSNMQHKCSNLHFQYDDLIRSISQVLKIYNHNQIQYSQNMSDYHSLQEETALNKETYDNMVSELTERVCQLTQKLAEQDAAINIHNIS